MRYAYTAIYYYRFLLELSAPPPPPPPPPDLLLLLLLLPLPAAARLPAADDDDADEAEAADAAKAAAARARAAAAASSQGMAAVARPSTMSTIRAGCTGLHSIAAGCGRYLAVVAPCTPSPVFKVFDPRIDVGKEREYVITGKWKWTFEITEGTDIGNIHLFFGCAVSDQGNLQSVGQHQVGTGMYSCSPICYNRGTAAPSGTWNLTVPAATGTRFSFVLDFTGGSGGVLTVTASGITAQLFSGLQGSYRPYCGCETMPAGVGFVTVKLLSQKQLA